jgi:hypothetical protein
VMGGDHHIKGVGDAFRQADGAARTAAMIG